MELEHPHVPAGNNLTVGDEEDFHAHTAGFIGDVIDAQAVVLTNEFPFAEVQGRITH